MLRVGLQATVCDVDSQITYYSIWRWQSVGLNTTAYDVDSQWD